MKSPQSNYPRAFTPGQLAPNGSSQDSYHPENCPLPQGRLSAHNYPRLARPG